MTAHLPATAPMDEPDAVPAAAPASPEMAASAMLMEVKRYDPAFPVFGAGEDHALSDPDLAVRKSAADLLVRAKLARFSDETRSSLQITNAGRYWALHGSYLGYLKDETATLGGGGAGRQRNPEMEALRSEYMRLRLNTFWWSFGLSIAGFVMSLFSVAIALFYGSRLLP